MSSEKAGNWTPKPEITGKLFMGNNLHFEVLPKRQRLLFDAFSGLEWFQNYYLAGGTALALQIAHRRSVDFDFFTAGDLDVPLLKKRLSRIGKYHLRAESEIILDGDVNDVRVSFFSLPETLIGEKIKIGHLKIAAKADIAAMKIAAISMRGSRKDFIDIYFLLKEFSLEEIIGYFEKKYGKNKENVYCALKGLLYFEDAEKMSMPGLIRRVTWGEVKKTILNVHGEYLKRIRTGGVKNYG